MVCRCNNEIGFHFTLACADTHFLTYRAPGKQDYVWQAESPMSLFGRPSVCSFGLGFYLLVTMALLLFWLV